MSISKRYLTRKPVCKVTFRVPKEAATGVEQISVVGDFNGWDPVATPMKRLKNGSFTATVDLEADRAYEFRYLYDRSHWENDWAPDQYVYSSYSGSDNSVVVV